MPFKYKCCCKYYINIEDALFVRKIRENVSYFRKKTIDKKQTTHVKKTMRRKRPVIYKRRPVILITIDVVD